MSIYKESQLLANSGPKLTVFFISKSWVSFEASARCP